jgi:hypothetical protein
MRIRSLPVRWMPASWRMSLLLLTLGLAACGSRDGGADPAALAGSPVGLWQLDAPTLLASVRKRYAAEGPDVVAREEGQARLVGLELQIREDGKFGLRSTALGLTQHIVGVWRSEGPLLRFFHQTVDGKPVEKEVQEEATFEAGRIVLDFDETGLDFVLVRK